MCSYQKTCFRKHTLKRKKNDNIPYSHDFMKTKKTRSAVLINFPVVSRLDLCSDARS